MKTSRVFQTFRGHLFREMTAAWVCGALLLQSVVAVAPEWWSTQNVINPQKTADDYAAANQGQLKAMAQKAALAMNDDLTDGAGDNINTLIDDWTSPLTEGSTRDDHAALTLGQLKMVAKPFYDRLVQAWVRPAGSYPWSGSSNAADDYAVANVGQLKAVFAFDITPADVNHNDISDLWETTMFGNLDQDMDADFDGDGLSNREEWAAGTSADSEDSDGDGFSDKVERDHSYDPVSRASNPGQVSYQLADQSYRMEHAVIKYPDNTEGQNVWHVNKFIDMPDNVDYDFEVVTGEKPLFPPLPPVPTHADFEFPYWYSFFGGSVCQIYELHTQNEFAEHHTIGGMLARVRAVGVCPSLRARTCYLFLETSSRAINTNDAFELEESSVVTVTIPAQTTQSNTFEATLEPVEGKERKITATPFFCEIVPDESMYDDALLAGGLAPPLFLSMAVSGITAFNSNVRGDLIQSVLPNGDKHFVTPKKTTEIPFAFVTLRASGATENDLGPNGKLEWHFMNPDDAQDTNSAQVDTDPLKLNVLRDKPRHVIASIGPKGGPPANDKIKMHVWVVWTKITPSYRWPNELLAKVDRLLSQINPAENAYFSLFQYGSKSVDQITQTTQLKNGTTFQFQILPPSIIGNIQTDDIPNLSGTADDSIPNNRVPGYSKTYVLNLANDSTKADSALNKWDVSRQVQVTIKNPNGILKNELSSFWPPKFCENQPDTKPQGNFKDQTPVPFPSGKLSNVEGNDDPKNFDDEDDNPYVERNNNEDALNHPVGYLSSVDSPKQGGLERWGKKVGDKLGIDADFIEFARVQLWDKMRTKGRVWFRISDPAYGRWHHRTHLQFNSLNRWEDDTSSDSSFDPPATP